MWTSSSSEAVGPSEFKTQIQRYAPRFVGYNQQDAQEFLRFLLDGLHNEVNRVSIRPRGSAEDYDHLPDLRVKELPVTVLTPYCVCVCVQKGYGEVSLMDCMGLFTKEDVLDGDEKPVAAHTGMRYEPDDNLAYTLGSLTRLPDLKRFSEARRTSKLSTFVSFPMKDLDLREFSSESSGTSLGVLRGLVFYEAWCSTRLVLRVLVFYESCCSTSLVVPQGLVFYESCCSTRLGVLRVLFYEAWCSTRLGVLRVLLFYEA
ncbi:hypothetical protein NHX12_008641 [Muraenolepis orangiensis]|uniref:ubiquitinyl hydrolase 1 n=1 Tax=Muraenolepis orangiensis TaxID=630683 RepID=A0A9Q0DLX0_9TELE|nr:hypothetical protein NHX12_008641 [Muraenolepis orangiensis]